MADSKQTKPTTADEEDLFDFAGLKENTPTREEDELDVEEFLAAVGAATEAERRESDVTFSEDLLREMEALQDSGKAKASHASVLAGPPAPGPAHDSKHSTPKSAAGVALPRSLWLAGLALLLINAGGLLIALFNQQRASGELQAARAQLEAAAAGMGKDLQGEIDRLERSTAQATSASVESGFSLEHVKLAIANHDYALARRQIYSLLSTIDRLSPARRDDLEARANFLLAETYRREADHRSGEEPKR